MPVLQYALGVSQERSTKNSRDAIFTDDEVRQCQEFQYLSISG
jgi:hypothetical protein